MLRCSWARGSAGLALAFVLPGCAEVGLLAPSGEVAVRQWSHLSSIFFWMLVVIVPIFLALPVIVWRYRLGGRGPYTPRWNFSWTLEALIWGVPLVVVSVLSWNLWRETIAMDPYRPIGSGEVLRIDAIGYDWKWLFIYPEQNVAAANRLVLPVGRPVEVRVTSATALQAFSVPRLGGQIYAMPGMASQFNLRADSEGRYKGLNTQYNGEHFARQNFTVEAMPEDAFEEWVETTKASPVLDAAALAALAEPGVLESPMTFGKFAGELFLTVVSDQRARDRKNGKAGNDG